MVILTMLDSLLLNSFRGGIYPQAYNTTPHKNQSAKVEK